MWSATCPTTDQRPACPCLLTKTFAVDSSFFASFTLFLSGHRPLPSSSPTDHRLYRASTRPTRCTDSSRKSLHQSEVPRVSDQPRPIYQRLLSTICQPWVSDLAEDCFVLAVLFNHDTRGIINTGLVESVTSFYNSKRSTQSSTPYPVPVTLPTYNHLTHIAHVVQSQHCACVSRTHTTLVRRELQFNLSPFPSVRVLLRLEAGISHPIVF